MEKDKSRFLKSDDGTVYDSKTSLTWMANDSWLDLDKEVSWEEAEKYSNETNKKNVGGYDDWRIPSVQEGLTLFDKDKLNKDFQGADIHLDSIFPPGAGNTHGQATYVAGKHKSSFTATDSPTGTKKTTKVSPTPYALCEETKTKTGFQ